MTAVFPNHIVAGSLCYVFRDDRVLLLRRARPPHQGLWSPPGGKMEHGESPQDCCLREVYEETGLTIQRPLLRAVHTVIDVAYPVHWLLFIFRADHVSGEFQQSAEGELRWISLAELDIYERPFTDLQHWPHVLETTPGIWQGKAVYDTPAQLVSDIRYD